MRLLGQIVSIEFPVKDNQCCGALWSLVRVSHPSQVVLPFPRWQPKEKPVKEDEVGPQVTHIYQVNAQLHATQEKEGVSDGESRLFLLFLLRLNMQKSRL